MKRYIQDRALRFFLLVILLPSLLFTLRLVGPGAGLVLSAAACGGSSGSSGTGDGVDVDGSAFTTDVPVDIPSPIAKGIGGVDPTSMQFTPSDAGDLAGTLAGATIDSIDGTIALIRSGEVYARTDTSSGRFEFEIPDELLGIPLALVVEGTGENEGLVSPPVIVTLNQAEDGSIIVQVAVTNTGVIQFRQIAVSSGSVVAFSAQDSTGNPFLGTVPTSGGSPSVLSDSISNQLGQLRYAPDGVLHGIDTSTALLTSVAEDGSVIVEGGSVSLSPSARYFSISPDGEWILLNNGESSAVGLALGRLSELNLTTLTLDASTMTDITYDWKTDDKIVAARRLDNGSYQLQAYSGLDNVKNGTATEVTVVTGLTTANQVANPSADRANEVRFVYECADGAGNTDLCLAGDAGTSTLVDMSGGAVANPRFTSDGSRVVYEEVSSDDGECEGTLALYDMDAATRQVIASAGCYPTPHPDDPHLVAYLTPVGGKLQVGIENLALSEGTSDSDDSGDEGGDDGGGGGTTTPTATATATRISLAGNTSVAAGSCLSLTLQGKDSSGNTANMTAGTTVSFLQNGSGTIYQDSACATPMNNFTYGTTQSEALPFYFKDNTAETTTITVSSTGLTSGTLSVTVTGGNPSVLALSGTQTISRYTCNAFAVTSRDSSGNTVVVSSDLAITLTSSGGGTFYVNSTCTSSVGGQTGIAATSSSKAFYFSLNTIPATSNPFTLTAAATSFTSGTLTITTTD